MPPFLFVRDSLIRGSPSLRILDGSCGGTVFGARIRFVREEKSPRGYCAAIFVRTGSIFIFFAYNGKKACRLRRQRSAMEYSYRELRVKPVINLADGKNLGKTCDVVFSFPEGKFFGIVVPGGKFSFLHRNDLFIPLRSISKIGEDVIFVDLKGGRPTCKNEKPRRDYSEYE